MPVEAFDILKINAEKGKPPKDRKISIKNKTNLSSVEKYELVKGKNKMSALKIAFDYETVFEPELGKINLYGEFIWSDAKEKVEAAIKSWQDDGRIQDKEVLENIMNAILARSSIETLIIARELGLPPPMPLPKVQVRGEEKKV